MKFEIYQWGNEWNMRIGDMEDYVELLGISEKDLIKEIKERLRIEKEK